MVSAAPDVQRDARSRPSGRWPELTKPARQLCCCLVLSLTSPLVWAAPADPDGVVHSSARAAAGKAFDRGKLLWDAGELAEALVEFEAAYQLSPRYEVLYHIGAVHLQLEHWAQARRAFELYLQLGADELSQQQVEEVRVHLEEANRHTATLTLTLNVPGAQVQVDGATVEPTTISGLVLETGEHVVRVSKPGFQPLEQVVRASHGENVHLVLPLVPIAPPSDIAEAAAPVPARPIASEAAGILDSAAAPPVSAQQMPLWVPWTISGVLATGWLTTAALAIKARHDRDIIERPGTSPERIDSARRLHVTLAVVSDVLLASTLTSTGISAYLSWWSEPPDSRPARSSSSPRNLLLSVSGHF
jgi:hypothetical protein